MLLSEVKSINRRKMYRTLCVVVLFAFSASALSVGQGNIDAEFQKCRADHGVSLEVLNRARRNPEALLGNPETRCFAACILRASQTINADGTLNVDRMIELLPGNLQNRGQIIEGFNACAHEQGADICETTYKTVKCVDEKEAQEKQ